MGKKSNAPSWKLAEKAAHPWDQPASSLTAAATAGGKKKTSKGIEANDTMRTTGADPEWVAMREKEKKEKEMKKVETWEEKWARIKKKEQNNPDSILHMAKYRQELDKARNEQLAAGRNHKELRADKKGKKEKKEKKD